MLEGLDAGPIIVGAYTATDGICPMLAAHRAGGRCDAAFFADAWDRFALRDERRRERRVRRATGRELRVLRAHLEASLLDDEFAGATLAGAVHEHRQLRARRPEPAEVRPRPGDRDRSGELRGRAGWSWTRLFRRYDDYERALARLSDAAGRSGPDGEPVAAASGVERSGTAAA